jgi:hypothetical protein
MLRDVSMLANSTCVNQKFKFLLSNYKKLYKSRAFVHWYVGEGIDNDAFPGTENNM